MSARIQIRRSRLGRTWRLRWLKAKSPKQVKPDMGIDDKVKDSGPKEPINPTESQDDIAKD